METLRTRTPYQIGLEMATAEVSTLESAKFVVEFDKHHPESAPPRMRNDARKFYQQIRRAMIRKLAKAYAREWKTYHA